MTITPVRLRLSRAKGFKLQDYSRSVNGLDGVNVARPGQYKNPFRVGGYFMVGDPDPRAGWMSMIWCESTPEYADKRFTLLENNAMAVDFYRRLMDRWPEQRAKIKKECSGKNAFCWCRPGDPCHGDVFLEIANS